MSAENLVANKIMDAVFKVHRAVGPGLLESAYVQCLLFELRSMGLRVIPEHPVPLIYGDVRLDAGYRLDMLVEDLVVVEVKSVDELHPIHTAQMITYLRLTGKRLGLLVNFNERLVKNGIRRIANGLSE